MYRFGNSSAVFTEISFKLVNISRSYARKQKGSFYLHSRSILVFMLTGWFNSIQTNVLLLNVTRSSAVAERPHNASCLSVVSFNIPTAQFFITSYCSFRFTSA